MNIRPAQLAAMQSNRVAGFVDVTVVRLYERYPEIAGKMDVEFLRAFVRASIREAQGYRIEDERTLTRFLDYAFGAYLYVAGNDIVPWLARHMSNLSIPAQVRVDGLQRAILEELPEGDSE